MTGVPAKPVENLLRPPAATGWDATRLRHARGYAAEHFVGPFLSGHGTEVVLTLLASATDRVGTWLDVGAGHASLFWASAIPFGTQIYVADRHAENLVPLAELLSAPVRELCYERAVEVCGQSPEHTERMRSSVRGYFVFDLFRGRPELDPGTFDLVTQFGLLGLARTAAEFAQAMATLYSLTAPGGALVGANWVWRQAQRPGSASRRNDWLTLACVRHAMDALPVADLRIVEWAIPHGSPYARFVAYSATRVGSKAPAR